MNKFLAIAGFLIVGICIQVLIMLFITDNVLVVSLGSGIWMSYMTKWYNKKFGKKVIF